MANRFPDYQCLLRMGRRFSLLLLGHGLLCAQIQASQSPASSRQPIANYRAHAAERHFSPATETSLSEARPAGVHTDLVQEKNPPNRRVSIPALRLRKPRRFNDVLVVFLMVMMISTLLAWLAITIWGFFVNPWFGLFMVTIGGFLAILIVLFLASLVFLLSAGDRTRPHPDWNPPPPPPEPK